MVPYILPNMDELDGPGGREVPGAVNEGGIRGTGLVIGRQRFENEQNQYFLGGIRGTGLDTPSGDVFCSRNDGRLLLVRLFGFFRHRLELYYKAMGVLLPSLMPADTANERRRKAAAVASFCNAPLVDAFATLRAVDGRGRMEPVLPLLRMVDFDMELRMDDGNPRPFHRVVRDNIQRGNALIRDPDPDRFIPGFGMALAKEVRFFEPVEDLPLHRYEITMLRLFLREGHYLPEHIDADRFDINVLAPMKWKAMTIEYPMDRESYAGLDGFTNTTRISAGVPRGMRDLEGLERDIIGGVPIRSDKTRASSFVQLCSIDDMDAGEVPVRGGRSIVGRVRFFLSLESPLDPNVWEDAADNDGERERRDERLLFAFIDRIPVEETSDGFLVRIRRNQRRQQMNQSFFVEAIRVHCLVGILKRIQENYVIWKDGCWTTAGRNRVLRGAFERMNDN